MRTMRNILGIGSVLVLSTVATTAQAQNLLTNGSFEKFRGINSTTQASITGAVGTGVGGGIAGGTGRGSSVNRVTLGAAGVTNTVDLDGWKITSGVRNSLGNFSGGAFGGIEVVGSSWSYTGITGAATNNGFQSISLAGGGGSMISQTVSVVAGQRYSLDFWYATEATNFYNSANAPLAGRDVIYDVIIDGVVVNDNVRLASDSFINQSNVSVVRTQSNMGWKFKNVQWVSTTTGNVDVGFAMQTGTGLGVALDNVSFHAMVPEPGSFVLAGLGLLPLGYMIRRRKNDAE
jgi:hypothetical protein